MKIKNSIYNSFLAAIVFLAGGCDSFLGKAPDNRVEIRRLEDVEDLVAGSYSEFGVRSMDVCTDNYTLAKNVPTIYPVIRDLYTWSMNFEVQEHQDSPSTLWEMFYGTIATVNHALEALDRMEVSPEEESRAGAIRGEALIIRSFQHFMLVNLFGKSYDETTASQDLGVPYVTVPERTLIQSYKRNTVEEVYQLAEKDLKEGLRLMEENYRYFGRNKYHFTMPTAYLYASRFYTWRNRDKEDVGEAIYYAEKSIDAFGGMEVMRNWDEYYTDYNGPTDVTQAEVGLVQESDTWSFGIPLCYTMTRTILDQHLVNPFKFTDYRLQQGYDVPGDMFVPVFYAVIDRQTNKSAIDVFPLAEAMLNAAEGYARNSRQTDAMKFLHEFGKHVYKDYDPNRVHVGNLKEYYHTENGTQALLNYILFERRVQFLYKGIRWFDIRRYQLEVEHKLTDGTTVRLSECNPNRYFQIPHAAIVTGMEPNQ